MYGDTRKKLVHKLWACGSICIVVALTIFFVAVTMNYKQKVVETNDTPKFLKDWLVTLQRAIVSVSNDSHSKLNTIEREFSNEISNTNATGSCDVGCVKDIRSIRRSILALIGKDNRELYGLADKLKTLEGIFQRTIRAKSRESPPTTTTTPPIGPLWFMNSSLYRVIETNKLTPTNWYYSTYGLLDMVIIVYTEIPQSPRAIWRALRELTLTFVRFVSLLGRDSYDNFNETTIRRQFKGILSMVVTNDEQYYILETKRRNRFVPKTCGLQFDDQALVLYERTCFYTIFNHEFVHWLDGLSISVRTQCRWFKEGLADYIGMLCRPQNYASLEQLIADLNRSPYAAGSYLHGFLSSDEIMRPYHAQLIDIVRKGGNINDFLRNLVAQKSYHYHGRQRNYCRIGLAETNKFEEYLTDRYKPNAAESLDYNQIFDFKNAFA